MSRNIPQIPPDTHQTSPRHPPDISREHEKLTDAKRHRQTHSNSTCQCLGVSFGVCWHVAFPGEALGVSGGCLEVSEWHSWKSEALECVWGYLGSHSLQYGAKTLFWHNPKKKDFFHLTIRALRVLDTRLVLEFFCPTRTRLGPNTTRTE